MGDFVLPGEHVTALRMEIVIIIPAVVLFTWLVVLCLKVWYKPEEQKQTNEKEVTVVVVGPRSESNGKEGIINRA